MREENERLKTQNDDLQYMFDGECETHQKNNSYHKFEIERLKARIEQLNTVIQFTQWACGDKIDESTRWREQAEALAEGIRSISFMDQDPGSSDQALAAFEAFKKR